MHKAGLFMMLTTLSLFLLAVLWDTGIALASRSCSTRLFRNGLEMGQRAVTGRHTPQRAIIQIML